MGARGIVTCSTDTSLRLTCLANIAQRCRDRHVFRPLGGLKNTELGCCYIQYVRRLLLGDRRVSWENLKIPSTSRNAPCTYVHRGSVFRTLSFSSLAEAVRRRAGEFSNNALFFTLAGL